MTPLTDPNDPVLAVLLTLPVLEQKDADDPRLYASAANPKILTWHDGYEGPRSDVQLYGYGTQGGEHRVTAMRFLRSLYEKKAKVANRPWLQAVADAYVKLGGKRQDLVVGTPD